MWNSNIQSFAFGVVCSNRRNKKILQIAEIWLNLNFIQYTKASLPTFFKKRSSRTAILISKWILSVLIKFKSVYMVLWVMNYYPPNNLFPTDETLQASRYSVPISFSCFKIDPFFLKLCFLTSGYYLRENLSRNKISGH